MQTVDQFNPNLGTAILLVGGAGVGKTSLGLRLVKGTYAFVADLNFQSGLDYLKRINQTTNVVGFDTSSPNENGKPVAVAQQYARMLKCLTEATKSDVVKAIFLDSAMFIEDIFKAKICGASTAATVRLKGFDQWGDLQILWRSTILQLRESGKILILSAHENKEQDESDQIYKYQIALDGAIRGKLPALCSDVWRCEIAESMGNHTWNVRMLGNARQEHLKRSSRFASLKPVVTQDELVKFIQS